MADMQQYKQGLTNINTEKLNTIANYVINHPYLYPDANIGYYGKPDLPVESAPYFSDPVNYLAGGLAGIVRPIGVGTAALLGGFGKGLADAVIPSEPDDFIDLYNLVTSDDDKNKR